MNLIEVMIDAQINDGGTYLLTGHDNYERAGHTFGYYVSTPRGIENLPQGAFSELVLSAFIDAMTQGGYLGLWKDDHGNWSIDETLWFDKFDRAMVTAVVNKQRAIWNIKTSAEVIV